MDIGLMDYIQIGSTILFCGVTIGVIKSGLKENKEKLCKIENRVDSLEKTYNVLTELSTDIKWMKKSLENLENKK